VTRNTRVISIAIGMAMLGACASAPTLYPIRSGSGVSLAVAMAAQSNGGIEVSNSAIGDNVRVGSGTGMLAGAALGLTCGPFAVLCVPFGAMTMGGVGALAGAGVGVAQGLPAERVTQLRDRLSRLRQTHDLVEELRRDLSDRASRFWELKADASYTQVLVELQDLQLTSAPDEQIGFVMSVRVSVRPAGAAQAITPLQKKTYTYAGLTSPAARWLDERSDFVDTSFSSAIAQIATQIISDLAPW
jgi:hypothetical protein